MDRELLTKKEAGDICSLSPGGFGQWVRQGKMPRALPGTRRWKRSDVIEAIAALGGGDGRKIDGNVNPFDKWLEKDDRHKNQRRP